MIQFYSYSKKPVIIHLFSLVFLVLLGTTPISLLGQCGITIPNGERCEAPGGDNCEFYICVSGNCVPSGLLYPPGTKCGCFGDECYEDFCDATGNCACGFFAASPAEKCASEQNICNGVENCDGISGVNCSGAISYPAAVCDDGVTCTEDCNPVDGCVQYPIHDRCDDGDVCTNDVCDTTATSGCINACTGAPGCAGSPNCTSFPIELMDLRARVYGMDLVIEWMTATETNNYGFEVELSTDGLVFEKQGFVRGAGTTREAQFYEFKTQILRYGINYVRLKQLDVDGGHTYTQTLQVKTALSTLVNLDAAFPNPVNAQTTIRFSASRNLPVALKLFDQNGKEVKVLFEGLVKEGNIYTIGLDVRDLSPGMYLYQLSGKFESITKKLTVY